VSADEQTKGRGQGQKSWFSPPKKNLYTSFHLITKGADAHNLAQLLSISAMQVFPEIPILFKWPNDLFLSNKKIAGSLCEVISDIHAIVGLGLNVLMTEEECAKIDQSATSLFIETGISFNIREIGRLIRTQFQDNINLFTQKGFAPFLQFINEKLAYKGKTVIITSRGSSTTGVLLGINEQGSVSLKKEDGEMRTFFSGSLAYILD
jgi:BirA family biotin operon repressor/biotin-[acetyl-CoA-carboxylase] ligase